MLIPALLFCSSCFWFFNPKATFAGNYWSNDSSLLVPIVLAGVLTLLHWQSLSVSSVLS
ncbi:hypothetical protein OK016_02840 [Vibrio chagasii]|nr:hypothetical protein [Vibrio chagasii]